MTLLYLVAGEASGDALGARLIAALNQARPGLHFAGIGGERMAEQGFESLFPMRELALMGLLEVLPNLKRLSRRLDETAADIAARRPALVVTIDSPGFTLRVAARARSLGIPVLHYVAPQVWAWRPGRVTKIAREVDGILALLPFEAPFFEAAGIPVRFVGHSILESGADQGDTARFRARHGVAPSERVVLVMPGSRRSEVSRLLPVFGATLAAVAQQVPGLRAVVPVAGPVAELVRAGVAQWPAAGLAAPILLQDIGDKYDAYAAARESGGVGLIKSGTSSLEVALAGVPMAVGYRVNPVTAAIVKRLVKVRYASLVNLLADRPIIPEFLQERCTPALLAATLVQLLTDPAAAAAQRAGFAAVMGQLRPPEGLPSAAAAAAVLAMLDKR